MSDLAIKVSGLSKQYRIGTEAGWYRQRLAEGIKEMFFSSILRKKKRNSHEFELFWALHDVSFEVTKGEVVGIIGLNGSGKSTLLKILSRITNPTKGRIEFWGRMGSLLEVGTGFSPELSGRENIFLNGIILGMRNSDIEARFDEIVDFAEIGQFLDMPVKHYSSGMYVRLAFSVAAFLEPEILVLDEVLAVGDVGFRKKSMEKMHEVVKDGRTVLFVSHSLEQVMQICTRCIVLDKGLLIYDGDVVNGITTYMKLADPEGGGDKLAKLLKKGKKIESLSI